MPPLCADAHTPPSPLAVTAITRHIDARIPFATVAGARVSGVNPAHASFAELAAVLAEHGNTRTGKDGPAVVMSAFREGQGTTRSTRGQEGRFRQEALISETWLLGLDFDSRPDTPSKVLAPLASCGLAHIAYSTHSHGRLDYLRAKARKELASRFEGNALDLEVERYARAPRYRVLVRLARSVSPAEYRVLWSWLDRYLGGGSDHACSDPTRLYFTPRRAADDARAPPWVNYSPGVALDPDALPDGTVVADLLSETAAAGRAAPRATLAPAEQTRRRTEALALPEGQRTEAARKARRILEAAVDRVRTTPEGGRRKRLFATACRIGEWSHVLGPAGEAAWRDALLDAARHLPDVHDHTRQVDNGIARGRGNPVDVRAEDTNRAPAEAPLRVPLAEARERLVQLVRRAANTPGVTAIAADPGVGKTSAVVAEIPALLAAGKRIRLAVPSNRLAREVLADVRRAIVDSGDIVSTCGPEPKRTARNCVNFAAVNAGRRAAGPGGARAVCRECDLHPRQSDPGACRFFAERASGGYDVTVTTHALEVSRARWGGDADTEDDAVPPDVLVIDEAPRAADAQYTVTYSDLCSWRGARDLVVSDDAFADLLALFARARDPHTKVGSAALAGILPAGAVTVRRDDSGRAVSSFGWGLLDAHASTAARGAIPEALANAPEAEALEALESACRNGWLGCYVSRTGELRLTMPLRPTGRAVATLYLDGTATEASARALFGDECRFERLRASLHHATRVARVTWSAAKHALPPAPPDDECDTPQATRDRRARVRAKRTETLTRLAAVVRRYESTSTAWVLHKAWCDDPAVRDLLADAFEAGRAIYYRGAEATGSNGLASCSRIVLADFFMPRAAVASRAETLALRAGTAAKGEDWWGEALHLLETSERVQAAHRVRPGSEERELVWLCERDLPEDAGWPEIVDVDVNELVVDELDILPPGHAGAAAFLRRAVANAAGGVVALGTCAKWRRAERAWSADGRCAAWADAAGVALAYARTSAGGSPSVVFYAHGTTPAPEVVVSAVVAGRGEGAPPLAWVEWCGERVPTDESEGERLLSLLRGMPSSERPTFEALASRAGLSVSTLRRRLRPLGVVSLADLAAALSAREAMPPEAEAPQRGDAVAPPLPKRKQAQGTSYSLTPLGRGRDAGGYTRRGYVRSTYRRSRVS